MTKIKICGLFRPCDIDFVNEAKPDYCGFILNFPKSHRSVTPEQARKLRAQLSPDIVPVGVFVDQPVEEVAALQNDGTITAAQLHGREDSAYLAALRSLTGGKPVWKAFKICSAAGLEQVKASAADMVLLDNGQGTGETFDWSLVRELDRPFLLAGGLASENLSAAIQTLHPWGVDLSSGVETDGIKDREKILKVVTAVRQESGEGRR